jgi:hypothetical protein
MAVASTAVANFPACSVSSENLVFAAFAVVVSLISD